MCERAAEFVTDDVHRKHLPSVHPELLWFMDNANLSQQTTSKSIYRSIFYHVKREHIQNTPKIW